MKKTGLLLFAIIAAVLVLEAFALKDSGDDLWTITAFMRALPVWAVAFIFFALGVLFDHFYIRSWNR